MATANEPIPMVTLIIISVMMSALGKIFLACCIFLTCTVANSRPKNAVIMAVIEVAFFKWWRLGVRLFAVKCKANGFPNSIQ